MVHLLEKTYLLLFPPGRIMSFRNRFGIWKGMPKQVQGQHDMLC